MFIGSARTSSLICQRYADMLRTRDTLAVLGYCAEFGDNCYLKPRELVYRIDGHEVRQTSRFIDTNVCVRRRSGDGRSKVYRLASTNNKDISDNNS